MSSGILAYHNDWAFGPQQSAADLNGTPEEAYKAASSPWYTPGNQTGSRCLTSATCCASVSEDALPS